MKPNFTITKTDIVRLVERETVVYDGGALYCGIYAEDDDFQLEDGTCIALTVEATAHIRDSVMVDEWHEKEIEPYLEYVTIDEIYAYSTDGNTEYEVDPSLKGDYEIDMSLMPFWQWWQKQKRRG